MNDVASVAVVLMAAWLLVLTLGLVLSIRQIAILSQRVSAGASFDLEDDGLHLGTELPRELVAELGHDSEPFYVLLISAGCGSCREIAHDLRDQPLPSSVIALVPGQEELADRVIELLPPAYTMIRDPRASEIARELSIKSTPYALAIADRVVRGKAYLHSASLFGRLVDAHEDTLEPRTKELIG